MNADYSLSLAALAALVPVGVLVMKRQGKGAPDGLYWTLLCVAVAGPAAWAMVLSSGAWQTGFSGALWVTVAASMALFLGLAILLPEAWRLTPLVSGYLFALGLIALIWQQVPATPHTEAAPAGWIEIHIVVSVLTYAFATLAALAALAAVLQERALKAKRPTKLTHTLPSVTDCDRLLVRLLLLGEVVLGFGLLTGVATQYMETGRLLAFDHKIILSIATFIVIAALLYAHHRTGMRGRKAARVVLTAYLLLTLGYPGVKFVTDVVLG